MRRFSTLFGVLVLAASRMVAAQSIFVDMDGGFGGSEVGTGAPSSSFGAAAGIPGYWNQVQEGNGGPLPLRDTTGGLTNVSMHWSGSGGSFGYNNPNLTGDFRLLMADAEPVGHPGLTYTISGLSSGQYRIFTYACKPQGQALTSLITVPDSAQGTVAVTGPMPPNFFVEGVTHSVHDIFVTGDTVQIRAAEIQNSYVNGFQIVAVPEPIAIFSFVVGFGLLVGRRRRM